ncbi:hypothetical protein [Vibrio caribbeanicus]|uniref:Uncharacterized protein n=1 Tax=Vibrio caribbeanicus ATCC BAA-2122 TaxID=796620 RepID=E3BKF4_9VIBR|nr:hypothetical protein [Vibrio caribbeanicus]EFP96539.1 hypothetical protein VIBC2010_05164 [Vibrio caribbeanicus ATCC BAA-2122]
MWFKFFGLIGVNALVRRHLNDPVNWVAFIRNNELDKKTQIWWRDSLELPHLFDYEICDNQAAD